MARNQNIRTVIDADVVGKKTAWIPASSMTSATTSGAAPGQVETTTNVVNVETLDFDDLADEYAHFNRAMPKSWDEGTISFQVFWTSTATDTDGVAWALQAVAVANDGALDAAYGTAVVVTDNNISAAEDVLVTAESGAVTIAGSPGVDEFVAFRIFRDVSDANDDMLEDARLLGIKLFYTVNAVNDD